MYGNLVALHILANHQMWLNGGFRLIEHMLTPPTHCFLESSGQVVYMETHPYSWRTLTPPPPPRTFRGRNIWAGAIAQPENQDYLDPTENFCMPARPPA
jgi:hypothetical protein